MNVFKNMDADERLGLIGYGLFGLILIVLKLLGLQLSWSVVLIPLAPANMINMNKPKELSGTEKLLSWR